MLPDYYINKKRRLQNLRLPVEYITHLVVNHLRLNTVEDGDERCYDLKREAMEELPHILGALAAEGYPLFWQHSVVAWDGVNYELWKYLDKISRKGDIAPFHTMSTFVNALGYFIAVLNKAYAIPTEAARDAFFNEALRNLVASYPLYNGNFITVPPELSPRLVIQ